MEVSKHLDCIFQCLLHALLDNLLTLFLDDVLRVVLTHLLVGRSREAHNGIRTRVADIDSDQHGSLLLEGLRELEREQVTSNLAVDLTQDVGSLRQVELAAIPASDHL